VLLKQKWDVINTPLLKLKTIYNQNWLIEVQI